MADGGGPHAQTRLPRCDPNYAVSRHSSVAVPWEEGCDETHERKSSKYWELKEACQDRGWKTWLFPVEVGCRGLILPVPSDAIRKRAVERSIDRERERSRERSREREREREREGERERLSLL